MIYWIDWGIEVIEAIFEVTCLWLLGTMFVKEWIKEYKLKKEISKFKGEVSD